MVPCLSIVINLSSLCHSTFSVLANTSISFVSNHFLSPSYIFLAPQKLPILFLSTFQTSYFSVELLPPLLSSSLSLPLVDTTISYFFPFLPAFTTSPTASLGSGINAFRYQYLHPSNASSSIPTDEAAHDQPLNYLCSDITHSLLVLDLQFSWLEISDTPIAFAHSGLTTSFE
jgi:hypothetical protein